MDRETQNLSQQMLATLRTRLLVMCASVGIALDEARRALAELDFDRAVAVVDNDAAIDALENEIDELALRLLARTQPVAVDLRCVVSALRMVTDLERIGDEAVALAEQTMLLRDEADCDALAGVQAMFARACASYEKAVDIFRDNDADGALAMRQTEDDVSQVEVAIIQGLMQGLSGDVSDISPQLAMHAMLMTRSLTRIWRRAVNIAEHVYFINQGESLKHHGAAVAPVEMKVTLHKVS